MSNVRALQLDGFDRLHDSVLPTNLLVVPAQEVSAGGAVVANLPCADTAVLRLRSVVGLDFTHVAWTALASLLDLVFYVALYLSEDVNAQYRDKFSRSELPAQEKDIVFAAHALITTAILVVQCFRYQVRCLTLNARGYASTPMRFIGVVCLACAARQAVGAVDLLHCVRHGGGQRARHVRAAGVVHRARLLPRL